MCVSCENCVRAQKTIDEDSGLVLYSDPDMSKFTRTTPAALAAALDHLEEQKHVLGKTKFAELEVCLGITYDSCALLYSEYWTMVN